MKLNHFLLKKIGCIYITKSRLQIFQRIFFLLIINLIPNVIGKILMLKIKDNMCTKEVMWKIFLALQIYNQRHGTLQGVMGIWVNKASQWFLVETKY